MIRRIGLAVLTVCCVSVQLFAAALERERPISGAQCVLAIYEEDWGLASAKGPQLILAMWDDDSIVWSDDLVHGGPPFRTRQLRPGTLRQLVSWLEKAGRFEDRTLRQPWVTWDSRFTTIITRCKGRELLMRWSPEVTVTADATPDALTAYKHFRTVWEEIRRRSASLISPPGSVATGSLSADHGVLIWRETSQW